MNPSNYETWKDPEGGHWFKMNKKEFAGVIWRPAEIAMAEDDQITFEVEYLEGPDIPTVPKEHEELFGKVVQAVILEGIAHAVAQDEALAEQYTQSSMELNGLVDADGKPLF